MQPLKRILFSAATLVLPVMGYAADAVPAAERPSDINMPLVSLVSIVIILLFVVGMLAGTLKQLSIALKEKIAREKSRSGTVVKTLLLLLCMLPVTKLFAADAEVAKAAATTGPDLIGGIPSMDFYLVVSVIVLELLVIFALSIYIHILIRSLRSVPEAEMKGKPVAKKSWFWDKFNAAATIENEKDVLLDHNYDGIQELDNSLPPWWKYGFYLTIVVAVIYLYRFHISHDGLSSQQEFMAEMQKGEEEKAAYLAKSANNVDENNVVLLTSADEIAKGKDIFVKNCAPCHVADGGGNVGPNLTDDYWLHGGSIKDVFKSIKYGWQDKGMKSWKDDFSPKEIQELASFVKSLKGTHPAAPKAAQGELYIEASPKANNPAKVDSSKTVSK
jgi:cytochrome c oxidase cbb3-type subunit III